MLLNDNLITDRHSHPCAFAHRFSGKELVVKNGSKMRCCTSDDIPDPLSAMQILTLRHPSGLPIATAYTSLNRKISAFK